MKDMITEKIKETIPTLSNNSAHTIGQMARWTQPQDTILDIGCGNGEIAHILEQLGYTSVYNVDFVDLREFDIAHFKLYDGVSLPFEDSFFDFISINFVLHHVPNDKKLLLLDEIKRVSRGILFILEDTPRNFIDRFISGLHGRYFRHKIKSTEPFGFYSQKEWEDLFKKTGWKILASEKQSRLCRNNKEPYARSLFVIEAENN
ncbi:MAG: class I SAM-dependent methyltransferase [bacterium]|nr:class I SAM-dependent methyltransferase [bacterium]